MKLLTALLAPLALAGTFLAALPAAASSTLHSANTEMGYTQHPDHAGPGKSRAQVLAELDQARKDGSWQFLRVGAPVPVKLGAPLTRAQVLADLERAQKHPSWSARSRGAPVSME